MITYQTALDIACAYREIEAAEKLLADIEKASGDDIPDIRDVFGRPRGLQLGVPSGESSHRLFNVPWTLARPVIETHIAQQHATIATLCAKAMLEMGTNKR